MYPIIAPCAFDCHPQQRAFGATFIHPLPRGFRSSGAKFSTEEARAGETWVKEASQACITPQEGFVDPRGSQLRSGALTLALHIAHGSLSTASQPHKPNKGTPQSTVGLEVSTSWV